MSDATRFGRVTAVITTIQEPTAATRVLGSRLTEVGGRLVVVGDRKSPEVYPQDDATYLPLPAQDEVAPRLARAMPLDHYARKNVGYLAAIAQGASCIFDTDDDNAPGIGWRPRTLRTRVRPCTTVGWTNVYRSFTDAHIWPRGFPLERLRDQVPPSLGETVEADAPVQQSLVDGSPDVDAVWRLALDREFAFNPAESVLLSAGAWCPFNSQSTWWFPSSFVLLYLPASASFRLTDIWRSFVAQRCLWELGLGVVFHAADTVQNRNIHDLLRDFEQEVPGYLGNARFCRTLENVVLSSAPEALPGNLHRCYEALIAANFMPRGEIIGVEAWLHDLERCSRPAGTA